MDPVPRRAGLDDIDALVSLNAEVQALHRRDEPDRYLPTDRAAVSAFFRTQLLRDDVEIWIAWDASGLVVYAQLVVDMKPDSMFTRGGKIARVEQLAVRSDARRRGVGRRIMELLHERADAIGCDRIELDVAGFNAEARRFCQALGYAEQKVRMVRGTH
jgi:GNAT superfamily N-acetyltransferase